jgi:hypothetical protein
MADEGSTINEINFVRLNVEEKHALLDILGYEVSEDGIILDKKTKKEYICPITNEVVFIENASILPGSTVVINTSELSLAEYFTKYIEKVLG